MCFKKDKWKDFEPTQKYLDTIKHIKTITELDYFLDRITPTSDDKDYWQTPEETLNRGKGDCEDFSRLALDILIRIIKIEEARFVIHSGYDKARWGDKKKCHAICVFEWQGKFGVFSNNQLYIGLSGYEGAGKLTFKDGLKYQEVRDSEGKIESKKSQWIGTF